MSLFNLFHHSRLDHYTFFLLFELLNSYLSFSEFGYGFRYFFKKNAWFVCFLKSYICDDIFSSLFRYTFLELYHFPSNFCNFVILIFASKESLRQGLIFLCIIIGVCVCCFLCLGICETLFL